MRKQNIDEMFERVYQGVRGDISKKLENTQDKVREIEDKDKERKKDEDEDGGKSGLEMMEEEWAQEQIQMKGVIPGEEAEAALREREDYSHKPPTNTSTANSTGYQKNNDRSHSTDSIAIPRSSSSSSYNPSKTPLCRRCHEITYHSNPILPRKGSLPTSKPITQILSEIASRTRSFSNPPLLIHVLDVADFPLSFVPFAPPRGSKVLYVINRADVVCERSSSMGHVRAYFREELVRRLEEEGIRGGDVEDGNRSERGGIGGNRGDRGGIGVEVHPVSALKGWGIKELLVRIFQLRNAESNVYLIGMRQTPLVPLFIIHFSHLFVLSVCFLFLFLVV